VRGTRAMYDPPTCPAKGQGGAEMALITIPQYVTYIAYALKRENGGRHIAVGFDNQQVLGVGLDTRMHGDDPATAAVNLMQGDYQALNGTYSIALTYPPSEACLGMAKLLRARAIYAYQGGQLREWRLQGANPPWQPGPPAHGLLQVDVPAMPGGFGAANDKDARAKHWYDHLEDNFLHPDPRNFLIYAQHAIVRRLPMLPPQLGVLPAPGGAINTAMTRQRRALLMLVAQCLVSAASFRGRRGMAGGGPGAHPAGHNIGCVITDSQGEIIGWGINQVNNNPTLHAETYAVMDWMVRQGRQPLPAQAEFFTTLMSCHMCAGVMATACPGLNVHYSLPDPIMGTNALARNVNGTAEALFNTAQLHATNFVVNYTNTFGPNARTTAALNDGFGALWMAEAVPTFKRMAHYIAGDDAIVHQQARGLINSICPNLV
jgi:tRNA(Arg) A34 adenosine deaminase TadA